MPSSSLVIVDFKVPILAALRIDTVRSREIFERQMNQRWSPSRHMLEEGGQGFCRFCDSRPLLLTVRGYC